MSNTRVVHLKREPFDVNIGRLPGDCHYGNPFSDKQGTLAEIVVPTREEAIKCFREWLEGDRWGHVSPARRVWILDSLPHIKGKVLGCWCKPKPCHGDVLAELADRSEVTPR